MELSMTALDALRTLVASHVRVSDPVLMTLAEAAREIRCPKGSKLLAAGAQATLAGVVLSGIQGEFYELADGTRKAKWLAKSGDVFGSLEDLVRDGPARATIEAVTDSTVLCVPYAHIRALALQHQEWAAFYVSLIEALYRKKSEREYTLLMLKAEERYGWFLDHFGAIGRELSQEVIASYLGITPVHLSRVRASGGVARKR